MQVPILFATPLWKYNETLPKGAMEWAYDHQKSFPESVLASNRGGYQSPPLPWSEFKFKHHIGRVLISNIKWFDGFEITNWWLNINEKGNYNTTHTHPNSDLSGIWYITDNDGELYFQDPLIQTRSKLYEHILGVKNAGIQMDCKAGSLLIFPADVPHRVEEHVLDTKRISVSFNINSKPQGGDSY